MVDELVSPAIGRDVSPTAPLNHWNVNGPLPDVATLSVEVWPGLIADGVAVTLPEMGVQVTVTVTVVVAVENGGVHWPVMRTEYCVVADGITVMKLFCVGPPIAFPFDGVPSRNH